MTLHLITASILSLRLHAKSIEIVEKTIDECICRDDSTRVLADTKKHRVIICYNAQERINTNTFICPKFQIIRCSEKKEIIEEDENFITPSIISIDQSAIKISLTHVMLDTTWNMVLVPVKEYSVHVNDTSYTRTDFTNVFVTPKITKQQQDSLLVLLKELGEKTKVGRVPYPSDEKSIYLLLLGALNGNKEARNMLKSIRQRFIPDGAIAETIGEIWVEY